MFMLVVFSADGLLFPSLGTEGRTVGRAAPWRWDAQTMEAASVYPPVPGKQGRRQRNPLLGLFHGECLFLG